MVDPFPSTGTDYTGTPQWVKVFGITALIVVLLIVILMFTGVGGEHGPSRHAPASVTQDQTPPADLSGHTPPEGSQ